MMKASELMTGDYARVNRAGLPFKKGTVVQVLSIDSTNSLVSYNLKGVAGCKDVSDDDGYEGGIWLQYLDPIPLTAEILKENGFKIAGPSDAPHLQSYVLAGDKEDVYAEEINDGIWRIDVNCTEFNLPVQTAMVGHVHHLQNWLRFCGTELEITISI